LLASNPSAGGGVIVPVVPVVFVAPVVPFVSVVPVVPVEVFPVVPVVTVVSVVPVELHATTANTIAKTSKSEMIFFIVILLKYFFTYGESISRF
jgi:hypothetical protein